MAIETIDHTTLTKLAEAGVLHSAHVVGQEGGWGVLVKYGMTERALAAQRSHQVRIFRKLETLVDYLKGVGIPRFYVDAVNYDPDSATAQKRPDRAVAMKDAVTPLATHPRIGHTGRKRGTFELVVHESYVVIYRLLVKKVEILRIKHTAQQWPPL